MIKKSIKINFIMNALLSMSSLIFPLVTFPYISRVLLPSGTGKISFALSIVSYFSLFAQLGIPTYGIRTCSKVRDNREELSKNVHELFFINTVMSVLAYFFLILSVVFIPRFRQDPLLFLISGMVIAFNDLGMEWLYQSLEKYSYIAIRTIAFKIIALLLMLCFVKKPSDYIMYCLINVLASSGSKILNFLQLKKYIEIKPLSGYKLKRHIKPIIVFFAMSCAVTIYTNLDIAMLGFLKSDVEVGYYNAAVKIKTISVSIVTSLGAVLLPRTSYYIENNMKKEYVVIVKKAIKFVLLISIPLAIYFIIYARECVVFLSGHLYESAIAPMRVIMPTLVLIGITNIIGFQILIPNGKESVVMKSEIWGAIIDLVINIVLIPSLASTGAAIGTVVAELVVLLYQLKALTKEDRKFFLNDTMWKVLLASSVVASVGVFLKHYIIFSEFIMLVISSLVFFGIYLCVLLAMKERLIIEILNEAKNKLALRK